MGSEMCIRDSPCDESVDVVNVHAPAGKQPLKDLQRRTLLTKLLQSSSQTGFAGSIGNTHFLIGGDMNTAPLRMSQLLQTCRDDGSLRTQARTHQRGSAKHGDLCIVGGVQASTLTTTASNHDPRHEPYGICFSSMPQRSATEQPSSIRSASSSPSVQDEPQAAPAMQAEPELENEMPKDVAATQQEETAVVAAEHSEEMIKPEDLQQTSEEEAAVGAAAVATGAQRRDYPLSLLVPNSTGLLDQ